MTDMFRGMFQTRPDGFPRLNATQKRKLQDLFGAGSSIKLQNGRTVFLSSIPTDVSCHTCYFWDGSTNWCTAFDLQVPETARETGCSKLNPGVKSLRIEDVPF